MYQYNNQRISIKGFSSFLVLIVLAIISTSIITLAVNKTNRQVSTLVNQQANIELSSKVTFVLHEQILNYIATGNAINQPLNIDNNTFNIKTDVVDLKKNNKNITGIKLSVNGLTAQTGITERTVSLLQMKRLETYPTSTITSVPANHLDSLVLEYFNLNNANFQALKVNAPFVEDNCVTLSSQQRGLIWINGSCDLHSINLGDKVRPVLVIIENGSLKLDDAYIYGLVIHLCNANQTQTTQVSGNSFIFGAFISSCTAPSNLTAFIYDDALLSNLVEHRDNLTTRFLEGSWLSL